MKPKLPGVSEIDPAYVIEAQLLDRSVMCKDGEHVRLMPVSFWGSLHPQTLRAWCHLRSRYGVVTGEAVAWLYENVFKDVKGPVVEIGAGHGDWSWHLRPICPHIAWWQVTDSHVQATDATTVMAIALMGQPRVQYSEEVQKLEALEAVAKYNPEVVFASWVTQKFDAEKDTVGEAQAFIHGVDEAALWATPCVQRYIVVGNMNVHGRKRLRRKPHIVHKDYHNIGLVSRAIEPHKNCIFDWSKEDE